MRLKVFQPLKRVTTLVTLTLTTISHLPYPHAVAKKIDTTGHSITTTDTPDSKKRKASLQTVAEKGAISSPNHQPQAITLSVSQLREHRQTLENLENLFQPIKLRLQPIKSNLQSLEHRIALTKAEVDYLKGIHIGNNPFKQMLLKLACGGLDNFVPIFPNDYADAGVQSIKSGLARLKVLEKEKLLLTQIYQDIIAENFQVLNALKFSMHDLTANTDRCLSDCSVNLAKLENQKSTIQSSILTIHSQLQIPSVQIKFLSLLGKSSWVKKLFVFKNENELKDFEKLISQKRELKKLARPLRQRQEQANNLNELKKLVDCFNNEFKNLIS